jgi:hypothetical protein
MKARTVNGGDRCHPALQTISVTAPSVANGIVQHHDWLPTFLAMAGEPDVVEKLKKGGYQANGKSFKNLIDGYNLLDYLTGKTKESPRQMVFPPAQHPDSFTIDQAMEKMAAAGGGH